MRIDLIAGLLLFWYIFIFFSTEILSYFHYLTRGAVVSLNFLFVIFIYLFFKKDINKLLKSINFRSFANIIILIVLCLTFIQGFFSAPSTTDSMVYHLPKVMYWMQEETVYQEIIRNPHDFKAPFAEYIVLHLYMLSGNDRLAFFSQWLAFLVIIYLSGVITRQLRADEKLVKVMRVFSATLPVAVMQSASTQVDLISTVLSLITLHVSLSIKEKYEIKKVLLLSLAIGLGFFTKATFFLYLIVPFVILLPIIYRQKKVLLVSVAVIISIFLIQGRFFMQNYALYGSILGKHFLADGAVLEYTNADINLQKVISNNLKNILIHIPIPIFSSQVYQGVVLFNNMLGLDINDPSITCCGTEFKILSVIYPQEDIVSNTPHLLLIFFGGILLFKVKDKREIKSVYLASVVAFILFSVILKWQPYHSRLEIPIFLTATIASVLLIKNRKILGIFLTLSIFLAISVAILNVSRPYVSYSLFVNFVKQYSRPYSSIPEAFYSKPRIEQYFNAEFFWNEPYKKVVENIPDRGGLIKVSFDVMDDFEYPLWVLLKEKKINYKVVPKSKIAQSDFLIKTSAVQEEVVNFKNIHCYKTLVKYGFACLYKKTI